MGALLDAYALVALLRAEPAAGEVASVLRGGDTSITAINLGEVLDAMLRVERFTEDALLEVIEPLGLAVIPVTATLAWRAAVLRARHYRRRASEVSLADCCLVAAATRADRVVTGDAAVLAMARAEGVQVVELR